MSFFKVECMHGCGQVCLLVTLLSVDLRPHLALFPASNQICPPAEMETFGPVCFCYFIFQSDCYEMVFLFHVCFMSFFLPVSESDANKEQTPCQSEDFYRSFWPPTFHTYFYTWQPILSDFFNGFIQHLFWKLCGSIRCRLSGGTLCNLLLPMLRITLMLRPANVRLLNHGHKQQ